MKRFLAPVVISLMSIAVSLGIVEIGVRFYLHRHHAPFRPDRPTMNYYAEKSGNNRDYWYSEDKPADVFRIITIGDSFTYGFRNLFDDAYPKRLERILNLNDRQRKVEVLNFGLPGYSTAMEIKLVIRALEKYHPDLIVLEITLNDPEIREYRAPRGALNEHDPNRVKKAGWKTWALVRERIKNTQSVKRYIDYYNDLFRDPETGGGFKASLAQIKKRCDGNNVKLVAMVFPLLSFPFDDHYPFAPAHEIIHRDLDELGIPYLDLLSSFRHLDPHRLQAVPPGFLKADPHPSEIAHRIAAHALYEWLAAHRLVPQDVVARCTSRRRLGPTPVRCSHRA